MRFGRSTLHLACLLCLIATTTCLPRNQYSESWFDSSGSAESSRLTPRSYEPGQARNTQYTASSVTFTRSDENEDVSNTTPGRRVSSAEDVRSQNRQRWYDASGSKTNQQAQQRQILQVLLQPSLERNDRLLTAHDVKFSNSVSGTTSSDARNFGNTESYGVRSQYGKPQNTYSSHENREIVNQNQRRTQNTTRVTPTNKQKTQGGGEISTRFSEQGPVKRMDVGGSPKPKNQRTGNMKVDIEMRIVTQRETQRRSPTQNPDIRTQHVERTGNTVVNNNTKTVTTLDKTGNKTITSPKFPRPATPKPHHGDIVFPDGNAYQKFVPRDPKCGKRSTFCETDDEDYPSDYISRILKKEATLYSELFGHDVISEPNVTQRIDVTDENPLCPSMEQVVFPKTAQNKENKWLFIVNQDQYVQGVRVETCITTGPCQLTENFPLGYSTSCKQKYIYRKLLSIGEDGKPNSDSFRLPSCCSCFIRQDTTSRAGVLMPSKKTTPAVIRSKRQTESR